METKHYLSQISRLERKIQNKLSEIYQLKTMACSVTVSNNNERVQTSGEKDKVGTVVSKIVDMEHEVDNMIDKRCDIVEQIESIENTEFYDILAQIYILKKELKVVAIEKKISYSHAKRMHGQAIEEFEKMYGKGYLGMNLNDTR